VAVGSEDGLALIVQTLGRGSKMSTTIVNLTLPLVVEEAESVLDTYPYHPYQQVFAIPNLRQKLLAYVLSRIHNLYAVINQGTELSQASQIAHRSLENRLNIEALIRQGIEHILQENTDWVSHSVPEEVDPGNASSHWFG